MGGSIHKKQRPTLRDKFIEAWNTYCPPFTHHSFSWIQEYQFQKGTIYHKRRWRLDFACPLLKLGIELDGFGFGHQSIKGRTTDNEKQNAAIEVGWTILRFTPHSFSSRERARQSIEQITNVASLLSYRR